MPPRRKARKVTKQPASSQLNNSQCNVDSAVPEDNTFHDQEVEHQSAALRMLRDVEIESLRSNTLKDDIQITMLNKLDVSTKVFNVKGQVHTVEIVLVDEEGNKMLGSIINEHWQNFKNLIELNSTILITKASLAENRAANKFMGNPNKVSFNPETNIVELNDFLGESYGFTFASFEDMNNNLFPPFHTVDIIGYITSSEKPTTFLGKGGEPTPKVIVHLKDLNRNAINVTFFGDYANQMTDYISNNPDKTNVVIILQFGRFKFWGEKTWASNNYVYSKLFIDEDVQAIISFKQRLIEQTSGLTGSSQKSIRASVNCSVEDDFLIKTEFNNIAEVHMKTVCCY
ncbi:replication protein A 70 kDa DNA-binding subunit E-like [Bidens hawaiensis]|uniref:replication protein A 70 kDa DNA-binding subunit E-like n=1 Tax=Bidens hawaiensis TaxID=980011 RepID=UPI00404ABEC7